MKKEESTKNGATLDLSDWEIEFALAYDYFANEGYDEAVVLLERLYYKQRAILGTTDVRTMKTINCLMSCYVQLSRWRDAIRLTHQLLEALAQEEKQNTKMVDRLQYNLMVYYGFLDRDAEAIAVGEKLLAEYAAQPKGRGVSKDTIVHALIPYYKEGGRTKEGLKLAEDYLAQAKVPKKGVDALYVCDVANTVVTEYLNTEQYEKAKALCAKWCPSIEKKLGIENDGVNGLYQYYLYATMALDDYTEALRVSEATLYLWRSAVRRGAIEQNDPNIYKAMNNVTICRLHTGRADEKLLMEQKVIATETVKALGADHPLATVVHEVLAQVYEALGQGAKANEIRTQWGIRGLREYEGRGERRGEE